MPPLGRFSSRFAAASRPRSHEVEPDQASLTQSPRQRPVQSRIERLPRSSTRSLGFAEIGLAPPSGHDCTSRAGPAPQSRLPRLSRARQLGRTIRPGGERLLPERRKPGPRLPDSAVTRAPRRTAKGRGVGQNKASEGLTLRNVCRNLRSAAAQIRNSVRIIRERSRTIRG